MSAFFQYKGCVLYPFHLFNVFCLSGIRKGVVNLDLVKGMVQLLSPKSASQCRKKGKTCALKNAHCISTFFGGPVSFLSSGGSRSNYRAAAVVSNWYRACCRRSGRNCFDMSAAVGAWVGWQT